MCVCVSVCLSVCRLLVWMLVRGLSRLLTENTDRAWAIYLLLQYLIPLPIDH